MSNELNHHGVLGQKWGKKNGPPYPLNSKDHSASEKKAGWKNSLSSNETKEDSEKFHLSDKQKKYIKIGIGVVATLGVGTLVYQTSTLDKFISVGKNYVNKNIRNGSDIFNNSDANIKTNISKIYNKSKATVINKFTGFNIKNGPSSLSENLKVNRGMYKGSKNDPLRNNCSHSTVAWILNEIGLDVKAKPMPEEFMDGGMTVNEFKRFFVETKFTTYSPKATTIDGARKELCDYILTITKGKDGAGAFRVPGSDGGHFMGWKVEGKEVFLVNPQIESDNVEKWLDHIANKELSGDKLISVSSRLDNLVPNLPFIKTACENA